MFQYLEKIPVRLRLSLAHAIWMALLFGAIGVGVYRLVERSFLDGIDSALLASSKAMRESRFNFPRRSPSSVFNSFLYGRLNVPPLVQEMLGQRIIRPYAQIIDLSGKVSANSERNITLPISTAAISRAERGLETFETFNFQGVMFREVTYPIIEHGLFTGELIQVAASLESTIDTLDNLTLILWVALPTGLFASFVFGYLLTASAFKPVRLISKAAEKLGVEHLGTKLPYPPAQDELYQLAQTFNGMLSRLEDAFKRLRLFSSNVSHELRTPIAVMKAEAELALRKDRTPTEYQNALSAIVKESTHMTTIIEDLLLFARAQSGNISIKFDSIPYENFLKQIIGSLKLYAEAKKISYDFKNYSVKMLFGTENYLHIAFRNILHNAIKHSNEGGHILIEAVQKNEYIQVTIQDFGEGIPKEAIPYIFDPFYRVDTDRNRKRGGSGIGLTLTDALIKLHGGKIAVEAFPGQGTRFIIHLPKTVQSDKSPS